ncbi:hypothetical protein [Bythopirellula goksoeyrii]|uniref:Carboxypeptidase regulatory-like domain-containing protein n=1 Tax=Bythopirellula goksoeyrii TaxID=1400387 RepID=A0A5B9Q871_9BACT|nr:hypothetical protein [Bythopirellula goksoeyrii]QEG35148.1 hypothetical protein Pr1d_24390 [Bythopirellula goksoeyrii]
MKQQFDLRVRDRCVFVLGALLPSIALMGCDRSVENRVIAHGAVTYQGSPIKDGTITFIPIENSINKTLAAEIVNGEYSISSDSPNVGGQYRVEIQAYKSTGVEVPNLLSPDRKEGSRGTMQQKEPFLPAKFNSNSELVANISPENTTLDFSL